MQRYLRLLVFAFSHLLPYPKLLASPQYSWDIQPLKILPSQDDTLSVSYPNSCGSRFGGFILRNDNKGGLRVGVLTQRSHARCSQLMGMQTLRVPYLKKSKFTSIASLAPAEEPSQLKILPLQNSYAKRETDHTDLQATFTSHCGKQVGLFLRPEANGLRLGVVEAARDEKLRCTRTTEVVTVKGLEVTANTTWHLEPLEDENKFTPYVLKRIPVQIGSPFALGNEKKYPIFFHRACHESPIGLVRQELEKHKVSLSLLVASYPPSTCPEQTQKIVWSEWHDGFVAHFKTLVSPTKLKSNTPSLRIARPLSYEWLETAGPRSLQLTSFDFCSRNIGIISRSFPEGLAVGIVQETTAKPCNSRLEKVSYAYEWGESDHRLQDVKPLQLLGSH